MNAAARIALFVAIALAVALTANLVLLDIANGPKDPVGRLSPRAGITTPPAPEPATTTTQVPAPAQTVPVEAPPREHDGSRGSHQDD